MKYTVKNEYLDKWFGGSPVEEIEVAQAAGFTAEEIYRLAMDWGTSVEALMEQVEEA